MMQPCGTAIGQSARPALGASHFRTYHRRRCHLLPRRSAYSDTDLFSGSESDDPYAGLKWVQQNEAELRRQAEMEQLEKEQAQSVGLYVRGRAPAKQVEINENDPARFRWHRKLMAVGDKGDYTAAEALVSEMARSGLPAGPRAYHVLVVSYLKGDSVEGALDAIRREVKAGIQPLPESYAAVVRGYVLRGDTAMAEAVWASNRRSGVDCTLSWLVLTAAMFTAGQEERGMELLEQGEAEGRVPDAGLYAHLISHLCAVGDVEAALRRLEEMQERGITPGAEHYSPTVEYLAAAGDTQSAEGLIQSALSGTMVNLPRSTLNKMMQCYLAQRLPAEELKEAVALYQRWLQRSLLGLDLESHALLMEAALQQGDAQGALSNWAYIKDSTSATRLDYVHDDVFGLLISELSHADLPLELYGVLRLLRQSGRQLAPNTLGADPGTGCSQHAVWFHRRLREGRLLRPVGEGDEGVEESAGAGPAFVLVDGVRLDASSLKVLNERGSGPAALSKLTVKEIRAELTARRQPQYGNKKDLLRRLTKARKAAEDAAEGVIKAAPPPSGIPQEVIEEVWKEGKLVTAARVTYYLRLNEEGEADDSLLYHGGDDMEDEMGEEGFTRRRRRRRRGEDDDFGDDDDEYDEEGGSGEGLDERTVIDFLEAGARQAAAAQQRGAGNGQLELDFTVAPKFTNTSAGLHQALLFHRAALDQGGFPTQQDVADLVAACASTQDAVAAGAVLGALDALRSVDPSAAAVAAGAHEGELRSLAAAHAEAMAAAAHAAAMAAAGGGGEGLAVEAQAAYLTDKAARIDERQREARKAAGVQAGDDYDSEWEELFQEFEV